MPFRPWNPDQRLAALDWPRGGLALRGRAPLEPCAAMTVAAGWYHCSVKPVSRSAGRSAVAAAAYRTGARLHDHALARTHDYTRRSGVVTTFALAPEGAPHWALDMEALWNAAEAAENRCNSQLAREYELALPSAVSPEEREAIARGFAKHLVDRYGVAVTGAIHQPSRRGDMRNFHAHILATTRRMEPHGLAKKTRILDDRRTGPQEVRHLRQYACDAINSALERAGVAERVDARSFESRGIAREATEHLGPTASEMERRGEETDRGSRNRDIKAGNEKLDELVGDLAAIEAEIVAEEERRLDQRYSDLARRPTTAAAVFLAAGEPSAKATTEATTNERRSPELTTTIAGHEFPRSPPRPASPTGNNDEPARHSVNIGEHPDDSRPFDAGRGRESGAHGPSTNSDDAGTNRLAGRSDRRSSEQSRGETIGIGAKIEIIRANRHSGVRALLDFARRVAAEIQLSPFDRLQRDLHTAAQHARTELQALRQPLPEPPELAGARDTLADMRDRLTSAQRRRRRAETEHGKLLARPSGVRWLWKVITGSSRADAARLARAAAVLEDREAAVMRAEIQARVAEARLATVDAHWARERTILERDRSARRRHLQKELAWCRDALHVLAVEPDLAVQSRADLNAAVSAWQKAFRNGPENTNLTPRHRP